MRRPGRAAGALLGALAVGLGAQNLDVTVEGAGPFTMDDVERLTPLVQRSLDARFPAGFARARATLATRVRGGPAQLEVVVEAPRDLPQVASLTPRIRLEGWRETLDGGSAAGLEMELESFRLRLRPAALAEVLAGDSGAALELQRLAPMQPFGAPSEDEARRFLEAAQAAGFPPYGESQVRNPGRDSMWTVAGELGPPISRAGHGVVEPRVVAGGNLAVALRFLVVGGRALERREVLALERRAQARLRSLWEGLEARLELQGYAVECSVGAQGQLVVEGMGFAAFDRERGYLKAEERRRHFRPTLLVNPAR